MLVPVFTEPAAEPRLEACDTAGHACVSSAMRLCSATSFVGVTAVAVHAGVIAGLPQGVQVIAGRFDAAQAIEDRIGIAPPVG